MAESGKMELTEMDMVDYWNAYVDGWNDAVKKVREEWKKVYGK